MRSKTISTVAVALATCGAMSPAAAADHFESPAAQADVAADIADIFIFRSRDAEGEGRLTAMLTFGGAAAPNPRVDDRFYCDPDVLYIVHIDRADDPSEAVSFDPQSGAADIEVYIRFARNEDGDCAFELRGVPGAQGLESFAGLVSGLQTSQITRSPSGLRAFAGLRDDPFFFNSQGLAATTATFSGDPDQPSGEIRFDSSLDSFGFRNLSVVAFELDSEAAASGQRYLRTWSTSARIGD